MGAAGSLGVAGSLLGGCGRWVWSLLLGVSYRVGGCWVLLAWNTDTQASRKAMVIRAATANDTERVRQGISDTDAPSRQYFVRATKHSHQCWSRKAAI